MSLHMARHEVNLNYHWVYTYIYIEFLTQITIDWTSLPSPDVTFYTSKHLAYP